MMINVLEVQVKKGEIIDFRYFCTNLIVKSSYILKKLLHSFSQA